MALKRACILVLAIVALPFTTSAQHPVSIPQSVPQSIHLDVVVSEKTGGAVPGLAQQDFTVLDNKQARPITSFKVVTPAQEPVEVILLLDSVNSNFSTVAYMRGGLEKFLRSNQGRLAHPTTVAILMDGGAQIFGGFSTDGKASADALDRYQIPLRDITRESEWGYYDRLQIALTAIHQLIGYASTLPGRKVVLWLSPGWPLLSSPYIYLDDKTQQQVFNDIVAFSTQMRLANMTLYNINPIGVGESMVRENYYEAFLNGVSKVGQVQLGNIGLQVLAIHSGGLAVEADSDIPEMVGRCLADVQSWYEIEFDSPPPDMPNEYHYIEVKVDKPGLTARTRDSYYSKPTPIAAH